MKTFVLAISFLISAPLLADVEVFKSQDNTGLNKLERIDGIEKSLIQYSATIKNMESTIEEQRKLIVELQKTVKVLKDNDDKRVRAALGERASDVQSAVGEIEKLKADFKEIENMKKEIERMKEAILDVRERFPK